MDCGRDTQPRGPDGRPDLAGFDLYVVRAAVWRAAGMAGYHAGYLCTECLQRRLGRPLVDADYLARVVRVTAGGLEMAVHPDYVEWGARRRAWRRPALVAWAGVGRPRAVDALKAAIERFEAR